MTHGSFFFLFSPLPSPLFIVVSTMTPAAWVLFNLGCLETEILSRHRFGKKFRFEGAGGMFGSFFLDTGLVKQNS